MTWTDDCSVPGCEESIGSQAATMYCRRHDYLAYDGEPFSGWPDESTGNHPEYDAYNDVEHHPQGGH